MRVRRALACATLAASCIATLPVCAAVTSPLRGFSSEGSAAERTAETRALAIPSEAAASRYEAGLASYVHRMASPGDYRTAAYMRDAFARAGWEARIVTYDVGLAVPDRQTLTILRPKPESIDLYEAAIPGDPWSQNHAAIGIPYSGYSADGDVSGPLVYANYARAEDFAMLAKAGVEVRGAIVLARAGKGLLVAKAYEAAAHGARAVLIFRDPMDDGYFHGDPYPRGPWRPTSAATRNTMTFQNAPGDPTAIGIPVPGAAHKPLSSIVVPPIPESPITAVVADRLFTLIGGAAVPAEWHAGFARAMHFGGDVRARFVLHSKRSIGPIWDVIARLPGVDPHQFVLAGGHRDAWTYGAIDPISGSVDLIQMADALGAARRAGWTPRRSIVIGSWDGEELNLFGSAIWADANEATLRADCVAYLNTDEVAYGPTFGAEATPDLAAFMRGVAADVAAPDGSALNAYWQHQDPAAVVDDLGGGSDHEAFVFREGLPGMHASFYGPFGTYHSAYDDLASLPIFDPGMHRAASIARFATVATMRLADAAIPDQRLRDLALAVHGRLDAFAKVDASDRRRAVVAALAPPLAAFELRAATLDAAADAAVASADPARIVAAYDAIRSTEAAFVIDGGVDDEHWARSVVFGETLLPTLERTLSEPSGDAVRDAIVAAFVRATGPPADRSAAPDSQRTQP